MTAIEFPPKGWTSPTRQRQRMSSKGATNKLTNTTDKQANRKVRNEKNRLLSATARTRKKGVERSTERETGANGFSKSVCRACLSISLLNCTSVSLVSVTKTPRRYTPRSDWHFCGSSNSSGGNLATLWGRFVSGRVNVSCQCRYQTTRSGNEERQRKFSSETDEPVKQTLRRVYQAS